MDYGAYFSIILTPYFCLEAGRMRVKKLLEVFCHFACCLLYTSDAADDMQCVDLGGGASTSEMAETIAERAKRILEE